MFGQNDYLKNPGLPMGMGQPMGQQQLGDQGDWNPPQQNWLQQLGKNKKPPIAMLMSGLLPSLLGQGGQQGGMMNNLPLLQLLMGGGFNK